MRVERVKARLVTAKVSVCFVPFKTDSVTAAAHEVAHFVREAGHTEEKSAESAGSVLGCNCGNALLQSVTLCVVDSGESNFQGCRQSQSEKLK